MQVWDAILCIERLILDENLMPIVHVDKIVAPPGSGWKSLFAQVPGPPPFPASPRSGTGALLWGQHTRGSLTNAPGSLTNAPGPLPIAFGTFLTRR